MLHWNRNVQPSGSGPFAIEAVDIAVPVPSQNSLSFEVPQPSQALQPYRAPRPSPHSNPQIMSHPSSIRSDSLFLYTISQPRSDVSSDNNIIEMEAHARAFPRETASHNFSREPVAHGQSYLSLKLAADLIPRFDGKPAELTNFLQQCKTANAYVKPADRRSFLPLICSKIGGHAKQLISGRSTPETLTELIGLLKKAFIRFFVIDRVNDELRRLTEKENEGIEFFGARVLEVLNRGRAAAKENYAESQIVGIITLLDNSAMTCFTRGLRDSLISTLLTKEKLSSLQDAIDMATRIELENAERLRLFQKIPAKSSIVQTKVYNANYTSGNDQGRESRRDGYRPSGYHPLGYRSSRRDHERGREHRYDRREYRRERGHEHDRRYQSDWRPQNHSNNYYGNRRDYSNNQSHYRKQEETRGSRNNDYKNLNFKGAPLANTARGAVLIAQAEPTESVTTSKETESAKSQ